MKKCLIALIISLLVSNISFPHTVVAKTLKLNYNNIQICEQERKIIKINETKKKKTKNIKWKIKSGKKLITIKKYKDNTKIRVTGRRLGKATILCKYRNKIFTCKIKVVTKRKSKMATTPTSDTPLVTVTQAPSSSLAPSFRPTHLPTEDRLMAEPHKAVFPEHDDSSDWLYTLDELDECFFFGSDIKRSQIERITFERTAIVPEDAIGSVDVSEKQNKSVMAWYYDRDKDGFLEMHIGQAGGVIANPNSDYLFSDISSRWDGGDEYVIYNIENLYTNQMKSMRYMFARTGTGGSKLINLGDYFDTSKVTDMEYCFKYLGNYHGRDENHLLFKTKVILGQSFSLDSVENKSEVILYRVTPVLYFPTKEIIEQFKEKLIIDEQLEDFLQVNI